MTYLLLIGFSICVLAAISDVRRGTIPNALTYPLIVLSPLAHVALALTSGASISDALLRGGTSLLGIAVCGAIPAVMWRTNAIGGGDVKLFAGLGGLLLPRVGFEAQVYVFLAAALIAPVKMAYEGTLFPLLGNLASQVLRLARPKAQRPPVDPALLSWFRLGPCFVVGFAIELALHWRSL